MPQPPLTILEYALLGTVGLSPMAGYDLHKLYSTTPLAHFSASPGAIYPALRRLAHRGLLRARLDTTTEARPRRVYSLTPAGERALRAWLRQPVTRDELIRGSGAPILRFALAEGRLSPEEALAYLDTYRAALRSYLDELETYRAPTAASGQLHGRLALEHGIRGFRSELEWTEAAAAEIQRTRRAARPRAASTPPPSRRRR